MARAKSSPPKSKYIEACFDALAKARVVVVDVETSGLDKLRNFVCGYVFTVGPSPDETWYLPVRHQGGGNIPGCRVPKHATDYNPTDIHPLEKRIAAVAADPSKHWIGHNLKYDMWLMRRHNIRIAGTVEDTRVNAALIDENQGEFGLGVCAEVMGCAPKKLEEVESFICDYMESKGLNRKDVAKEPMAYFWQTPGDGISAAYAKQDGQTTWQLKEKQDVCIVEDDLGRVWQVEKRVTKTLFNMETRGVPVDEEILEKVQAKSSIILEREQLKLPAGMNVMSPPQCYKYLLSQGVEEFPLTPKGAPSINEAFLETIPQGSPIIMVRKIRTLRDVFLKNAIRGHLHNGHVYSDFNQTKMDEYGVVTGRLSSSGPNMQQVPKRNKILAPLLRQIFRHPELIWYSNDYSQQEYRVFAEYAQAQMVLDAYAKDPRTDYHQLVADMLGVERDPSAKRINLAVIYNMGIDALALKLGKPRSVAQDYMNRMRAMMPEAKGFNKGCERLAKERGYVRTLLGRRRRFPNPSFAHKAGNSVIQGGSADITKLKMVEIDEYLTSGNYESKMILQVHDDINTLMHPEEVKAGLPDRLLEIMQDFSPGQPIELKVPMMVDSHAGRSWGHASFPKHTDWV